MTTASAVRYADAVGMGDGSASGDTAWPPLPLPRPKLAARLAARRTACGTLQRAQPQGALVSSEEWRGRRAAPKTSARSGCKAGCKGCKTGLSRHRLPVGGGTVDGMAWRLGEGSVSPGSV